MNTFLLCVREPFGATPLSSNRGANTGTGYLSDFPARLDDMGGAMSIPTHGPLLRTRHSRSLIQYQGSLDPPVLLMSSGRPESFSFSLRPLSLRLWWTLLCCSFRFQHHRYRNLRKKDGQSCTGTWTVSYRSLFSALNKMKEQTVHPSVTGITAANWR